jgi:hypothetical protein
MQLDNPKHMLSRASVAAGTGHSSSSRQRRHVFKKSKRRSNSKRRRVFQNSKRGCRAH